MANPAWLPDDDIVQMSLMALREIFRHFSPSELPPDLAACLAGDRPAIQANKSAYQTWKERNEQWRILQRATTTAATPTPATVDQAHIALTPVTSPTPTTRFPTSEVRASPQGRSPPVRAVHSPATEHARSTGQATLPSPRGKRTQDDFSLQVCTDHLYRNGVQDRVGWEPHVLFPECCTPPSCEQVINRTSNKSKGKKTVSNKCASEQAPRQSSRIKARKNTNGQNCVLEMDVQAFLDVPLQQAEGSEILALIGAGNIPIPSHIITPSQKQITNFELGQSSKAQPRRKKQKSPAQATLAQHTHVPPDHGVVTLQSHGPGEVQGSLQDHQNGTLPASIQMQAQPNEDQNQAQILPNEESGQALINDATKGLDDLDDPYLDQVDYSDDDMAM